MSVNNSQFRYEGANIVIVPLSTEESLKNFEKNISSSLANDCNLDETSKTIESCTSLVSEKCEKIIPGTTSKCSSDITNFKEYENKTPVHTTMEPNMSNKVTTDTSSYNLPSKPVFGKPIPTISKVQSSRNQTNLQVNKNQDLNNFAVNQQVNIPYVQIVGTKWKPIPELNEPYISNNVTMTTSSNADFGVPIQTLQSSQSLKSTSQVINSPDVNNFSYDNQQAKDKSAVSKMRESTITSQSWASNYMMNIGSLYRRPVKLNLSLNKNKQKKEDPNTPDHRPPKEIETPVTVGTPNPPKTTVNNNEKVNINENNIPIKDIKTPVTIDTLNAPKTSIFNKVNINKITNKCVTPKEVITKKTEINKKTISANNNKTYLIENNTTQKCIKSNVSKYHIPLESSTSKNRNKAEDVKKVSKYYIPLERKPKAPKQDDTMNSKTNKYKSLSKTSIREQPKPSTSKHRKKIEDVKLKRPTKRPQETQDMFYSNFKKRITSSSKSDDKYKYNTEKYDDRDNINNYRKNKEETIRRRSNTREDSREFKSKNIEKPVSVNTPKRRINRIYDSDVSEDEVPKTIISIVNDVKEISKQNISSNLDKFTDLREKLSAKYSKSLSDYIKVRQQKQGNNDVSSKHELDNLVISVPNKADDNNDVSSVLKRKKSPKAKKGKKIKLIIKVVCDDESSSSEDEKKSDSKIEQHTDLSFLDDFNIDEIVECLNSSNSPLKQDDKENVKCLNNNRNSQLIGENNEENDKSFNNYNSEIKQQNDVENVEYLQNNTSPVKESNDMEKNCVIKTSNDITKNTLETIYDEDTMDLMDYGSENYDSCTDFSFAQRLFKGNASTSYETQLDDFSYEAATSNPISAQESINNNLPSVFDKKKQTSVDNIVYDLTIKEEDNLNDTDVKVEPIEINAVEDLQIKAESEHTNVLDFYLNFCSEIIVIDDVDVVTTETNKVETDNEIIVIEDDIDPSSSIKQELIVLEENEKCGVLDVNKEDVNATTENTILNQPDSNIADVATGSTNTIQNVEIKEEKQDLESINEISSAPTTIKASYEQVSSITESDTSNKPVNIALVETNSDKINATCEPTIRQSDSIAAPAKIDNVNAIENIEIKQENKDAEDNITIIIGTEVSPNKNEELASISVSGTIKETCNVALVQTDNDNCAKNISYEIKQETKESVENNGENMDSEIRDESDKTKTDGSMDISFDKAQAIEPVEAQEENTNKPEIKPIKTDIVVNKDKAIDNINENKAQQSYANVVKKPAQIPVPSNMKTNIMDKQDGSSVQNNVDDFKNKLLKTTNCMGNLRDTNDGNTAQKNYVECNNNKVQKSTNFKYVEPSKRPKYISMKKMQNSSSSHTVKPAGDSPKTSVNKVEENSDMPLLKDIKDKLEQRIFKVTTEHYTILSQIHSGRYSRILSCQNQIDGELYAIKYYKRINLEKKLALKNMMNKILNDNTAFNVLHFYHCFDFYPHFFTINKFYPKNLKDALERSKTSFDMPLVYHLARQLASALWMLKKNNIVHSDINPSHILLNRDNRNLKLCGFDAAYYMPGEIRVPDFGKHNYQAPETIIGYPAGFAVDVWAMALVIYEMITKGRSLFYGKSNNGLLFQQMCAFGNMPVDMIMNGRYACGHFIGRVFVKQNGNTINTFYETNRLSLNLNKSFNRFWGDTNPINRKNFTAMVDLLHNMLCLHPTYRMNIDFIWTHKVFTYSRVQ